MSNNEINNENKEEKINENNLYNWELNPLIKPRKIYDEINPKDIFFKSIQFSPDGLCLLTNSDNNIIKYLLLFFKIIYNM